MNSCHRPTQPTRRRASLNVRGAENDKADLGGSSGRQAFIPQLNSDWQPVPSAVGAGTGSTRTPVVPGRCDDTPGSRNSDLSTVTWTASFRRIGASSRQTPGHLAGGGVRSSFHRPVIQAVEFLTRGSRLQLARSILTANRRISSNPFRFTASRDRDTMSPGECKFEHVLHAGEDAPIPAWMRYAFYRTSSTAIAENRTDRRERPLGHQICRTSVDLSISVDRTVRHDLDFGVAVRHRR